MRRTIFALMIGLAGVAMAPAEESTRGLKDAPAMARAVSAALPAGTPVEEARAFLKREGFRFADASNARFGNESGIDFLYAVRADGRTVHRDWRVAVVHRDGKVVKVLAEAGWVVK